MHQEVLHAEAINNPPDDDQDNMQGGGNEGGGAESDATASQNSDDEGSTVATEGSTMRGNSEPGGSGSSSGSSNAGGTSQDRSGIMMASSSTSQSVNALTNFMIASGGSDVSVGGTSNKDNNKDDPSSVPGGSMNLPTPSVLSQQQQLAKPFRLALLKAISNQMSDSKDALSIIPLLQVMLVILAELDGNTEEEVTVVETVVKRLLEIMNFTVSF
jgi:E3 ubiquitin-protein ligase UBR4